MHDGLSGLLLALVIVIGIGVVVLIGVLLALAKAAFETRKRIHKLLDHYETTVAPHLAPMVQSAHSLIDDLSPKLKNISTNLSEVSDMLRSEAQHLSVSLSDVVERTHQQAARVDNIVSSTLNGLGQATAAVQEGIAYPIRRISGVLDGLRAGIGSLRRKERPNTRAAAPVTIIRQVDREDIKLGREDIL